MTKPTTTPVIVDHEGSITFTFRTSPTGTVQAWGVVNGMEYTSDGHQLRSLSVSADRVYDGRLREMMMQIDEWYAKANAGSTVVAQTRANAMRDVLTLLTSLQPVDQPQGDYTAQVTATQAQGRQ